MSQLDQLLLNFKFKKNYDKNDFFVSSSNFYAFTLIDTWPNWEKNIINICGERYCGKTHLAEIFLKKNKGKLINLKTENIKNLNDFRDVVIDHVATPSSLILPSFIVRIRLARRSSCEASCEDQIKARGFICLSSSLRNQSSSTFSN